MLPSILPPFTLSHFLSTSLAVVFSLPNWLRARDKLQKNKQRYELYASKCSKKANVNTSKLLGMANTLRMWTTLSAMESYFPVIWVHPWVYRHGIVETSSSSTTKGSMPVSLRPSSLVRKRVYNWASATKGANWFPRWPPWLADILRPVYSHSSPEWGLIPGYFLMPYTVEEGARDYFKCASFIQHMWCSCCCHIAINIWYLL